MRDSMLRNQVTKLPPDIRALPAARDACTSGQLRDLVLRNGARQHASQPSDGITAESRVPARAYPVKVQPPRTSFPLP